MGNLAHSSYKSLETLLSRTLVQQQPLLGGKCDRTDIFLHSSTDKPSPSHSGLELLPTKPWLKPAGSDRLDSLDATCLLWPAREQACVVSGASSCVPYASCTAALTGHEQPRFMHKCWVRTVAQRHSIIQLALFGAKHGGVREYDRTPKRLDQSFSPRNPTK